MSDLINGVYQLPETPVKDDSHQILLQRSKLEQESLKREIQDLEQQVRFLRHQNITLKNNLHGIAEGSVTLTQALAAVEQNPDIVII